MASSTDDSPGVSNSEAPTLDNQNQWRLTKERLLSYSLQVPNSASEAIKHSSCCQHSPDGPKKEVEKYNEHRNRMVEEFGKLDELLIADRYIPPDSEDKGIAATKWESFAINISNIANFVIFAVTVLAAVLSGSLALVASALDSLLDLMSGLILWFTSLKMRKPSPYTYPIGKQRMQPIGILLFSAAMASLGLQVVIISVEKLISKEKQVDLQGSKAYLVIIIMGISIVVMFALAFYCNMFKSKLVRAYADDHFFDALTNVVGLASAILAAKFKWWIDPLGALVLAIYTVLCWIGKIKKNVRLLIGKTAPPEILQKITYICWNHDKRILQIDTVKAYSCGVEYVAEVDIVLPKDMQVWESHDIAESLQNKLESFPFIERAFVHIDYEVSHKPEHTV